MLVFESKHREIKEIVLSMASRKNILISVGIRHELELINYLNLVYENVNIIFGSNLTTISNSANFPGVETIKVLSRITIDDIIYKTGVSILTNVDMNNLQFGVIQHVYYADEKIYSSS